MDFLNKLNPQQQEAVITTAGPMLVLAGAGSGKTRVITYRIAYLVEECGVFPYQILAVTFTNKAAKEMKERVAQLISHTNSMPTISTFHSLCVKILRRNLEQLGGNYTKNFTIYDTDDQTKIIKACMKDLNLDEKTIPVRTVQFSISGTKNRGQDPRDLLFSNDSKKILIGKVFELYEERLEKSNALDFDDLLIKSVKILRQFPDVQNYYNNLFKYILIDEYQDTNPPQFNLIRLLTLAQQNLCVVGDPDQSIYKFRAADIQNILDFEKHYPKAKTIKLTENYRSTKVILNAANYIIKNNFQRRDKDLFTQNEEGEKIRYYQAVSGEDEADFVIREIQRLQRLNPKTKVAILYRTNAQSRLFEEACRRVGLNYTLVGGFSFYQRAEIKDIVAYLKLILNLNDNIAFDRVINTPPRGIGKTTLTVLRTIAREHSISLIEALNQIIISPELSNRALNSLKNFHGLLHSLVEYSQASSLSDLIKMVIHQTGYSKWLKEDSSEEADARLLNLEELVTAAVEAEEREESLRDFIDHAALVSNIDNLQEDSSITLMTIHSAKGLEFPVIFVVGLEKGLFPSFRSENDPSEMEEERRLCYVALTRAQSQLYITHSESRRMYGEIIRNPPSMFLKELPFENINDFTYGESWLKSISSEVVEKHNQVAANREARTTNYKYSENSKQSFYKNQPEKNSQYKSELNKSNPTSNFKSGDRARHSKYGMGVIIKREGNKLTISFPGYGVKKLIEEFANLEKV